MANDRKRPVIPSCSWDTVRELCLALPGVEESTSYGTPALKVKGKLFVRKHQDGESLVVRIADDRKAARLAHMPDVFYVTDHYRGYPYVLVRLAAVPRDVLGIVLEEAHGEVAPKPKARGRGHPKA
ncbi:MAG: MmcQ/YjbR family DNA-binding protein [Gemmataceae bacterium]